MGLNGPDWFNNKTGLLLRHEKDLAVTHVEFVPLTLKQKIAMPEGYDNAVSVLVFANFIASSGQFVADITQFNQLEIILKKSGYQLKELNP